MPKDCAVQLEHHCDGKLDGWSMELVSMLLYADDMALLSQDTAELEVRLQTRDRVSAGCNLHIINATKPEILYVCGSSCCSANG